MKRTRNIKLRVNDDKWGKLIPIEGKDKIKRKDEIPFEIKRIYYIYEVNQEKRRGFHSHKKLEQVLICVHGSVKILLKTPDEEKIVKLNNPNKGLYIGPNIWREMYDWEDDAVLLVLASNHYDEKDYIRNYEEYEKYYNSEVRK